MSRVFGNKDLNIAEVTGAIAVMTNPQLLSLFAYANLMDERLPRKVKLSIASLAVPLLSTVGIVMTPSQLLEINDIVCQRVRNLVQNRDIDDSEISGYLND